MNEYLFYQQRYNTVKTVKTELCRLDIKAQKALRPTTALTSSSTVPKMYYTCTIPKKI